MQLIPSFFIHNLHKLSFNKDVRKVTKYFNLSKMDVWGSVESSNIIFFCNCEIKSANPTLIKLNMHCTVCHFRKKVTLLKLKTHWSENQKRNLRFKQNKYLYKYLRKIIYLQNSSQGES